MNRPCSFIRLEQGKAKKDRNLRIALASSILASATASESVELLRGGILHGYE